jgi:hypothetical protein
MSISTVKKKKKKLEHIFAEGYGDKKKEKGPSPSSRSSE